MNTRFHKLAGAAFGTFSVICLTTGVPAHACNLPGNPNSHLVAGANTSALFQNMGFKAGEAHDSVAAAVPARSSGGTNAPAGVQGLWQVNFSSGGQVVDMAFEAFHSDGTEFLNDITPPQEGNVCLGVWVQSDRTSYKLTHPAWTFDGSGNFTGTAMIEETLSMTNADKFTGSYTLNYYDTNSVLLATYAGTVSATRILPNY